MIDPLCLRQSPETIANSLKNRGYDASMLTDFQALDHQWRQEQQAVEALKATRNAAVPTGGPPSPADRERLASLSNDIKALQSTVNATHEALTQHSLTIPNILDPDTPLGPDETHNVVVSTHGEPRDFSFEPRSHDALGTHLGLIDFERSAKISGARFAMFTGMGAALERAISTLMLDTHVRQFGYRELSPPVMINTAALYGTGQLPKFEDDLYHVCDDYWLSPTAEVQITNIHANEILSVDDLPLKYCAFTPCFRKEAGGYGRDLNGLIRLHQFNKVELVQFVTKETSNTQLDALLSHAVAILTMLELPYRVVQLCSGDLGFSAAKTWDLEVWLPSQQRYREISSCSNFLDFQSRRAKIRYKSPDHGTQYVHTINGSGLAVGRTMAAILENYQTESGTIKIPEALKPYIHLEEIINGTP